MYRTSNAYSVLQAIAVTAGLALVFWSIGLPSLRLAEAAAVTSFSDTLSDSGFGASSDHTIEYVATSGVGSGEAIVITFDAGFSTASLGTEDVDLFEGVTSEDLTTNWTVSFGANSITITSNGGAGTIAAGATTTILVGLNASGGDTQIVNPNPGSTTSYEVSVTSGSSDTGTTEIVLVEDVTVSASVDTVFTFAVSGVAASTAVGGTYTTGGDTSTTSVPFGELTAGVASTAAQQLSVSTNASNGFNVTLQVDQQLTSSALGADIDGFIDGAFTSTPTAWTSPTPSVGTEDTYGHWGISSDDSDTPLNFSNGANFVSASTSPVTVFTHNGVANGTGAGQGIANVIYRAEVSALQEAGTDYTAQVTYVATPIF